MANSKEYLQFDVSANLQKLVGEELVTNEEMAVIELVKNAYDSGARSVTIAVQPETAREPAYIEIRDDGPGMSLEEFRRIFMFAGYSERDEAAATATRVPTGEKGIGRFAADRLGSKLELTTKKSGEVDALRVRFNWTAFRDKKKRFSEIKIPYERVRRADLAKETSGTILLINGLRTIWSRAKARSTRDSIAHLLNPFNRPDDFNIEFTVAGMPELSGPVQQAPPENQDFDLRFRVSEDGKSLYRRFSTPTSKERDWSPITTKANLSRLGGLRGKLLYYISNPRKNAKGLPWGIQVYRDGFRLQPFGSPLEPWLRLTEKRAKRAGHAPLVPSRLFGFVEVSRLNQPGIRDITSRQGLMETEDFHQMIGILKEQTDDLTKAILEEISKPRWRETGREQSINIERSKVQTLGDLSIGISHEIRQPLQSILSEAGAIEDRLDELKIEDPQVRESLATIDDGVRRIDETLTFIQEFAKGDLDSIEHFDLAEVVRKTCRICSSQAKTQGITVNTTIPDSQMVTTNKNMVERVLINILRNGLEAIEQTRDYGEGEIFVRLVRDVTEHIVTVTDNGGGIPKELRPKIFTTFATKKTGGLGYGLSHSQTIIKAHGGKIAFETNEGKGTTFTVHLRDVNG
jgi:signal transduction histidine kinase